MRLPMRWVSTMSKAGLTEMITFELFGKIYQKVSGHGAGTASCWYYGGHGAGTASCWYYGGHGDGTASCYIPMI